MEIEDQKTKDILEVFGEICKVPRPSKKEEKICAFLIRWGKDKGFETIQDEAGNILIKVPGTLGKENANTVVIQSHVDMVCEKMPDKVHNFLEDAIEMVADGEWIKANGTTLGADNGMGVAMGMVLAQDEDLAHPPLELLFTVDEETGLTGAEELSSSLLEGRILINLDTEDDGVFTIGSAGGADSLFVLSVEREEHLPESSIVKVIAGNMKGGHSGAEIHLNRANALKVLVGALDSFGEDQYKIIEFAGGSARNAIPRDAQAIIEIAAENREKLLESLEQYQQKARIEYSATDPVLTLEVEDCLTDHKPLSKEAQGALLNLLRELPHGVLAMSQDIPDLVETSSNLASIKTENDTITIVTSQRSSVMKSLDELLETVKTTGEKNTAKVLQESKYPGWQPNVNSELLKNCVKVYKETFGREPVVEAIHAGLECGLIGAKYEGMDMISFGPTIENPHSPDERVHVPSITNTWLFLEALMKDLD